MTTDNIIPIPDQGSDHGPDMDDMAGFEPLAPGEDAGVAIGGGAIVGDTQGTPQSATPDTPAYRTLPHNLEAEKALLGAIFTDNRAYERVSEFLRADHFAVPEHGKIWDAAQKLMENGQIADPVTLSGFSKAMMSWSPWVVPRIWQN